MTKLSPLRLESAVYRDGKLLLKFKPLPHFAFFKEVVLTDLTLDEDDLNKIKDALMPSNWRKKK